MTSEPIQSSDMTVEVVTMYMRSAAQMLMRQAFEIEAAFGCGEPVPPRKWRAAAYLIEASKSFMRHGSALIADPTKPRREIDE